jgi:hypothetical protein
MTPATMPTFCLTAELADGFARMRSLRQRANDRWLRDLAL